MANGYNQYPQAPDNLAQIEIAKARSKGTASLVLGIFALVSCFTGIGSILGFVAAIVGLVLGSRARRVLPPTENGMATAGWVCSIIALCLCGLALLIVFGLLGLLGLGAFFSSVSV